MKKKFHFPTKKVTIYIRKIIFFVRNTISYPKYLIRLFSTQFTFLSRGIRKISSICTLTQILSLCFSGSAQNINSIYLKRFICINVWRVGVNSNSKIKLLYSFSWCFFSSSGVYNVKRHRQTGVSTVSSRQISRYRSKLCESCFDLNKKNTSNSIPSQPMKNS